MTSSFVPSARGSSASALPLWVSAATPSSAPVSAATADTTLPPLSLTSWPSLMSALYATSYSRADTCTPPSSF